MKIFLVFLLLFSTVRAFAEVAAHPLLTPQELEIRNRAKKRLYPGGQDEEPIKVQAQLPEITRKQGPASEAPTEDAHDD